MQHGLSWTVHLATKGILFFIIFFGMRRKNFAYILSEIFFSSSYLTVIITERLNIHFSRITWIEATRSFFLGCASNFINATLLYCWYWVKSFLTATLFRNFQNIFQTLDREQGELILTSCNMENMFFSWKMVYLTKWYQKIKWTE